MTYSVHTFAALARLRRRTEPAAPGPQPEEARARLEPALKFTGSIKFSRTAPWYVRLFQGSAQSAVIEVLVFEEAPLLSAEDRSAR